MKQEAFQEAETDRDLHPVDHEWRVNRIDIRSPLSNLNGHIVRVELQHPERGRVTDIGSGNDIFGAAFAALAHIFGRTASVVSVHSSHRAYASDDRSGRAMAAVVVDVEGSKRRGTAIAGDVIYASLAAFLDALASGGKDSRDPLSTGLNLDDDVSLLGARPCQVRGLDENGDFWLFASDDAGAAEAIATEFREEAYDQVRLSLPAATSDGP